MLPPRNAPLFFDLLPSLPGDVPLGQMVACPAVDGDMIFFNGAASLVLEYPNGELRFTPPSCIGSKESGN
jgi:hypothetical protein